MTNLAKDHPNAPKSIFVSPEQYAKAMLAAVDKERWTYGCWKHTVLVNKTIFCCFLAPGYDSPFL